MTHPFVGSSFASARQLLRKAREFQERAEAVLSRIYKPCPGRTVAVSLQSFTELHNRRMLCIERALILRAEAKGLRRMWLAKTEPPPSGVHMVAGE